MDNHSKQLYNYTVILEKEPDGGYHAFCPTLKGCHSQGDSFEETVENITEAIELYLESLRADNQPIPRENLIVKPLSFRILVSIKKPSLSYWENKLGVILLFRMNCQGKQPRANILN